MSNKKRILLDVDGVLADFTSGVLNVINAHFDTAHKPEHVTRFDIAASLGLSPEQASWFKREIGSHAQFARKLEPYPGAVEGYARLAAVADVFIVTSPWNSNPTWTHDREWWLKKHFAIPHSRVVHTSAKFLCAGDHLVDDKTEACVAWTDAHDCVIGEGHASARRTGYALRWSTLHNRLDEYDGETVHSWDELIARVA